MADLWHRVGVYFGLSDQTPEEKAAVRDEPRPTLRRTVFAAAVVIALAGLVTFVASGSVWTGVVVAVIAVASSTGFDLWQRRQDRLDDEARQRGSQNQ